MKRIQFYLFLMCVFCFTNASEASLFQYYIDIPYLTLPDEFYIGGRNSFESLYFPKPAESSVVSKISVELPLESIGVFHENSRSLNELKEENQLDKVVIFKNPSELLIKTNQKITELKIITQEQSLCTLQECKNTPYVLRALIDVNELSSNNVSIFISSTRTPARKVELVFQNVPSFYAPNMPLFFFDFFSQNIFYYVKDKSGMPSFNSPYRKSFSEKKVSFSDRWYRHNINTRVSVELGSQEEEIFYCKKYYYEIAKAFFDTSMRPVVVSEYVSFFKKNGTVYSFKCQIDSKNFDSFIKNKGSLEKIQVKHFSKPFYKYSLPYYFLPIGKMISIPKTDYQVSFTGFDENTQQARIKIIKKGKELKCYSGFSREKRLKNTFGAFYYNVANILLGSVPERRFLTDLAAFYSDAAYVLPYKNTLVDWGFLKIHDKYCEELVFKIDEVTKDYFSGTIEYRPLDKN